VTFDYTSDAGVRLTDVARLVFWRANMEATPDTGDIAARKAWLLRRTARLARADATTNIRAWFFTEISRLATTGDFSGRNEANLNAALDYIDRRFDCSDFSLHGLLRLFYLYRDNPDFPATTRARLGQTILNFKYQEDEPGPTMMFTRSENHRILFHSAEFLAGNLFPGATFPNSGMSGGQHAEKGARLANEWMRDRAKHGFEEWLSNTYFEEDFLALLNLFQFAPDGSETKRLAGGLLDLLTFILASHHFHGTLATTHGRAYEQSILHPELEAVRPIIWLLFGLPKSLNQSCSIGAVALATSAYAPSPAVLEMALDTAPLATRSRMGSFAWNPEARGGINCLTNRRDDYMVSGMVEARLGSFNAQAHAGQITLKGGVPIFVSCFDNPGPDARPSYWGGQFRCPKTIVSGDILAYIYDIPDVSGLTHCYFPLPDFDEVAEAGRWLCGRKGDAYVGVYSIKKYNVTGAGAWKNRELLCGEKRNIWILQAGSRNDYGSFEQFRTALRDARITVDGGVGESVRYVAPRNGELFLSHRETCTRDGAPVLEKPFPMLENPRGRADYGEGNFFHLIP
jgi:hypothetical protein